MKVFFIIFVIKRFFNFCFLTFIASMVFRNFSIFSVRSLLLSKTRVINYKTSIDAAECFRRQQ